MDARVTEVDRFVAAFDLLDGSKLNGRNEQVRSLRESAIASFKTLGFPGPKDEAWKYTPIARAVSAGYEITAADGQFLPDRETVDAMRVPDLGGFAVVMVDGVFVEALSDVVDADGLTVCSLQTALKQHQELVAEHLGTYTDHKSETFEALNTAFVRDGIFVHVGRGVEVSRPIEIVTLNTCTARAFVQPRILLVAEENSRVTVVELQRSLDNPDGGATFGNTVAEIYVGRHANVDHYRLQLEGNEASQVCTTRVRQNDSSQFSTFTATLGGKLVRNNLHVLPDGEHCETHLHGLFVGRGERHIDNHTFVDHARPNCESNELYKGILDERSTGVFNGKVFVRRDAQKTNAYQSNKSVVLSDTARMFAKPELEIYADDVKCSHGATTGQLDEEAMFYLQSRGISFERARAILLRAFAGDVLKLISPNAVREYLDTLITERISER